MNYVLILAGGNGSRMNQHIPKQFIELNNKPIFIHSLHKFIMSNEIHKIIFVCKKEWIDFAKKSINKFLKNYYNNIIVVEGGASRNDSLLKGIKYLENNFTLNDDDIILTHDAVRPFIDIEIINNNIKNAIDYDAVIDTCIKQIDTIVYSNNGNNINNIPNRDKIFISQTPQTAKYKLIKKIFNNQYDKYIFNSTDLCKLAYLSKLNLRIIKGDYFNIKITTEFDLLLAKLIMDEKNEN